MLRKPKLLAKVFGNCHLKGRASRTGQPRKERSLKDFFRKKAAVYGFHPQEISIRFQQTVLLWKVKKVGNSVLAQLLHFPGASLFLRK